MIRGYIKLWRKSTESQAFQNSQLWKIWTWCLMKASHQKRCVPIVTGRGTSEVHLLPGQFIFGRKTAGRELSMPPSSVRNRMLRLQRMGNIEVKANTHYSVVTVNNWKVYQHTSHEDGQPSGQAKDNQRTGKGQAKDTYKKVKKGEKLKKDEKKSTQKANRYPTDLQGE